MGLLKVCLYCAWISIICEALESYDSHFVKLDTFESSIMAMNEKLKGLEKYVVEIETKLDRQNKVNDLLRRQIVKLSKVNLEISTRLFQMENQFKANRNVFVHDTEKTKMTNYQKNYGATSHTIDSENMNKGALSKMLKTSKKSIAADASKKVEQSFWNMVQHIVPTSNHTEKASTYSYELSILRDDGDEFEYKLNKSSQIREEATTEHKYQTKEDYPSINHPSRIIQGRQLTEPNESVAFSAFLQKDMSGLQRGQIIKFDGVLLNDGNGYDVTTGIFTAPRSGLYLFSYAIEDYSDQLLWVYLRHDNAIRSSAVAKPYAEHQNVMGSNTLLLKVDAGSKVWISVYNGNRVQNDWTTFSGVLLH